MKYRAVLLDNDDTLMDFQRGEICALAMLISELGITEASAIDVYRAINSAYWLRLERGEISQAELHRARFRDFLAAFHGKQDADVVAARYAELLSAQAALLPGALAFVEKVAAVYPVAIVTNGIAAIQHPRIDGCAYRQFVQDVVISEEVGVRKPDPAILRIALRHLGIANAADAVLIGDSMSSDLIAAERAGMNFIWFNPHRKRLPQPHAMVLDAAGYDEILACLGI